MAMHLGVGGEEWPEGHMEDIWDDSAAVIFNHCAAKKF